MKRILAIILVIALMLSMVVSALATSGALRAKAEETKKENAAFIEALCDYIDENSTVSYHDNGIVEVTLEPASAAEISEELLSYKGYMNEATLPAQEAVSHPDYTYTTGQVHTPLPVTSRFIYSLLDSDLQKCYMEIDRAARNLEPNAFFDKGNSYCSSADLYFLYMLDTPELFYLGNTVSYGDDSVYFAYAASATEYCKYPDSITPYLKSRIQSKQAVFNQHVANFVASIPSAAPEVAKEWLIYSKIQRSAEYNYDALDGLWNGINEDNWSAYGVLCNGLGVCESYAEAFQTICNAVGIQCTGIVGDAGGGHKWNAVMLDGEWYQCDPTWDDPYQTNLYSGHDYFNITDEKMLEDHVWVGYDEFDTFDYNPPICFSEKYGWKNFTTIYGNVTGGQLHYFYSGCDTTCNNCSLTRQPIEGSHYFESPTDSLCDICGFTRQAGWVKEGGYWYFYENGEKLANAWRRDGAGWCYLGVDGAMLTNMWATDYSGEFFVDENGHCLYNRWVKYSGVWRYVGSSGYALRNQWIKSGGKWYYLESYYTMASNTWKKDYKGWCYLGRDGAMVINSWLQDGRDWYFVDSAGYMESNKWKKDSKGWVFLGSNGAMKTNAWVRDTVGWCFVGWDGYCVTSSWKQDSSGRWCYLNANGNMVTNKWVKDGGTWYYCDGAGYMVTGRYVINGKAHMFASNGAWLYEI